jgi:osmoprotectant transport system permease protein
MMPDALGAALGLLPQYLAWHVLLSAAALALGLLISLPLAILAYRRPRLRWPVLTLAGAAQTIPSIAMLALFFPVLLAVSALSSRLFGHGFSALGFLPALLALTIYSMLPILRTAITGLTGVDPAVVEAARGVGMTDRQRLMLVELPLAAPVMMAGIRTAAVWTTGAATLATPVGQTSLGNFIFSGLQTENWVFVLVGCAASAVLALAADQLLGLIERGLARRSKRRIQAGLGGLAVGVLLALMPLLLTLGGGDYRVGAKNFSEQYVLAELMASRLEAGGAKVSRREDLGSAIAYRALAAGEIDVYVDYSGTLWTSVLGRTDNPGREAVLKTLTEELKKRDGVVVLGGLGFENAYALAMKRAEARRLGIKNLTDLTLVAPSLTLGADLEILQRPEWESLRSKYAFTFQGQRQFQPTFMYRALDDGAADVITAFSSDGRIAANDLVTLGDPKGALPPYDAVILISPKKAHDARLLATLRPLVGAVTVEAMRKANYAVDRADAQKQTPAAAAAAMSAELGLK